MTESKKLFPEIKKLAEPWEEEWQDMPEFVHEDLTSYRRIIVHFRNEEDIQKFAELVGQKITSKTKSLWHPKLETRHFEHMRYVDEK